MIRNVRKGEILVQVRDRTLTQTAMKAIVGYSAKRKNKRVYYELAGQFYMSRLCTKAIKVLQTNRNQHIAVYKLGAVLLPHIKLLFLDLHRNSISPSVHLNTILEESKDFSFIDFLGYNQIANFSLKLEQIFLKFGFNRIRSYFESQSTTRFAESSPSDYTQQMIKKTENVSKRVFNLINRISEKEKNGRPEKLKAEKKIQEPGKVPRLELSKAELGNEQVRKRYIMENRCSELQQEIGEISEWEVFVKVMRGWKSVVFWRKTRRFKIESLVRIRFLRVAKKIFDAISSYSGRRAVQRARNELCWENYAVVVMKTIFKAILDFKNSSKRVKALKFKKDYVTKSRVLSTWKGFAKICKEKHSKLLIAEEFFSKKMLAKYFKLLIIRSKEEKIKNNEIELVNIFYSDKILKKWLLKFKALVNLIKQKKCMLEKAINLHRRTAGLKLMKTWALCTTLSKRHNIVKKSALEFFATFNKRKFINKLINRTRTRTELFIKNIKAEEHYTNKLMLSVMDRWYSNIQIFRQKKLNKYKSFLIHCKMLIEKGFYGWKKVFPKERYKRYRTMRLQNNINWNIIDSYFCEWIRATAKRINKFNSHMRTQKLKSAKMIFSAWKLYFLTKKAKALKTYRKLSEMAVWKKRIIFTRLNKYFLERRRKHLEKFNADLIRAQFIFKRWNSLSKKKIMLRYITTYHYSKWIFLRLKNYSFEFRYMKFSREFCNRKIKRKIFIKWQRFIRKYKGNAEKLESYKYYRNLKLSGVYFDTWINLYHKKLLIKYSPSAVGSKVK